MSGAADTVEPAAAACALPTAGWAADEQTPCRASDEELSADDDGDVYAALGISEADWDVGEVHAQISSDLQRSPTNSTWSGGGSFSCLAASSRSAARSTPSLTSRSVHVCGGGGKPRHCRSFRRETP